MLLIYLGIFRYEKLANPNPKESVLHDVHELYREVDVGSFGFFRKPVVRVAIDFGSDFAAKRVPPGTILRMDLSKIDNNQEPANATERFFAHCFAPTGNLEVVAITDKEYPDETAQRLLKRVLDDFSKHHPRSEWATGDNPPKIPFGPPGKPGTTYLQAWKDPLAAPPPVTQEIQDNLNVTYDTLQKTMADMLARGEKIDSLVAKSDNLSTQSKAFYSQARKQNSCCIMM